MHTLRSSSALPAGRTPTEKNDCTVVALCHSTGLPYAACRAIIAEAGRKSGRGFYVEEIMAECAKRGIEFRKLDVPSSAINVNGVPHFFPKGRYYVVTIGHALAIVDGVIHDPTILNPRPVLSIYEFTGKVHCAETMFE